MPGSSVKNKTQYEGLEKKGMSKERAARIANSPGASSPGGKSRAARSAEEALSAGPGALDSGAGTGARCWDQAAFVVGRALGVARWAGAVRVALGVGFAAVRATSIML